MKAFTIFLIIYIGIVGSATAQFYNFERTDTIPVFHSNTRLANPWTGGFNSAQFSTINLNNDGLPDLFVFDRTDHTTTTYINTGATGISKYTHAPEYEAQFPKELNSWALLRDYNCDGKKDIFSYSTGGIQIWENTSGINGLSFELVTNLLLSYQPPNLINLYVSSVDVPAIDDIDGDGDLDILTFGIFGTSIEYHKNMSMEWYGDCTHLAYRLRNSCWGHFSESFTTNALTLYDTCSNASLDTLEFKPNVDDLAWLQPSDDLSNSNHFQTKGLAKHSGSTILSLDLDGNGVKDLLLGDVSYNTVVGVINGGTAPNTNSSMISQDVTFPSYNTPIDIEVFPATFYEDMDNDGIRDLLASPNTPNQSQNLKSIYYYKNNGTDDIPVFSKQSDNFLQRDMIEVGTGGIPTFFDHNGDGLMDLLVSNFGVYDTTSGNYISSISLYENQGTSHLPKFHLITDDYQNLSSVGMDKNLIPAFADLDGDGDQDMIIGDYNGVLHRFINTAGAGNAAVFGISEPQMKDEQNNTIDVGLHAAPTLYDLDGDNDADLIIGERNGNLTYYQNTGNGQFTHVTDTLGKVHIKYLGANLGMAVPRFFKDSLGKINLFVGSEDGVIEHFNEIDGNLTGSFIRHDSAVARIDVGLRCVPAINDLNGDGRLDVIIGNKKGGLSAYYGKALLTSVNEPTEPISLQLFPNPAREQITLLLDEQLAGDITVQVFGTDGKLLFDKKTNASQLIIQTTDWTPGFYVLRSTIGNRIGTQSFVIAK